MLDASLASEGGKITLGDWIRSITGLKDDIEIVFIAVGALVAFAQAMTVVVNDNWDKMAAAFWRTIGVGLAVITIIAIRRYLWLP